MAGLKTSRPGFALVVAITRPRLAKCARIRGHFFPSLFLFSIPREEDHPGRVDHERGLFINHVERPERRLRAYSRRGEEERKRKAGTNDNLSIAGIDPLRNQNWSFAGSN